MLALNNLLFFLHILRNAFFSFKWLYSFEIWTNRNPGASVLSNEVTRGNHSENPGKYSANFQKGKQNHVLLVSDKKRLQIYFLLFRGVFPIFVNREN